MEKDILKDIYEDGINAPANNPNLFFRVGVIIKVYDEFSLDNINEREAYLSVAIQWTDGAGGYGYSNSSFAQLRIHFSYVSNGSGEYNIPDKGDFVCCGFRQGGYAYIAGYLDRQTALQTLGIEKIEDLPGFFLRRLIAGECYKKSKQGAETYYDRYGNLHFLIRDQGTTHVVKTLQEQFQTVDDNPILEVSIGKTYGLKQEGNEMEDKSYSQVQQYDFNNEIKTSTGVSTRFSIRDLKTGTSILIGTDGNIEVVASGDLKIDTTGKTEINSTGKIDINSDATVNINGESMSVAIAEQVSATYDGHTHMVPQAPSGTLPSAPPTQLMGTTIASQKVKLS